MKDSKEDYPKAWLEKSDSQEVWISNGISLDVIEEDRKINPAIFRGDLRGAGDDLDGCPAGFCTPKKTSKLDDSEMEALLRSCTSKASLLQPDDLALLNTCSSASKSSSKSSRRSEIEDLIRSCSTVKTRVSKASIKSVVKDGGLLKDKRRRPGAFQHFLPKAWKCKFCDFQTDVIKGQTAPVIFNHLKKAHLKEYRRVLVENRQDGVSKSGLLLVNLVKPIAFVKLSAKQKKNACFVCPYCSQGIPECHAGVSEYILKRSKRFHLDKHCTKKPADCISFNRYRGDAMKLRFKQHQHRMKALDKSRLESAYKNAKARGRDPGHIVCAWPHSQPRSVNLYFCYKCGVPSKTLLWKKLCPGHKVKNFPSFAWWSAYGRTNGLEKLMTAFKLDAKEKSRIRKGVKTFRNKQA